MMTAFLLCLATLIVIGFGVAGFVDGEIKRTMNSEEFKAEVEKRRKEKERQKAWRDKWK
jgi:hypothetical protein